MATKGRRPGAPLIEELFRHPYPFSFFQAARLLERAGRREAENPRFEGRAAVGQDADPAREAVRFRAFQALTFPPAEIMGLAERPPDPQARRPAGPPELTVSFLGLTGPSGVLPQHYSELVIRSIKSRNFAVRDFFDIFNHRTVSLFLRAWEKYRLPVAYERGGEGGQDQISRAIYALIGFGTGRLRGRLSVDDEALLHYSGHLGHWPRSAAGLEAMLSDYFERPIRIDQFQGRWLNLAEDETSLLPNPALPRGRFCRLGVDAVAGTRVWDVQAAFRLKIGPLTYEQFVRFMPGGDALTRLCHLTRLYVGPDKSFDAQLTLRKEEVPFCTLATAGPYQPRLGWNTWLKHREFRRDVSDAVYVLDNL